MNKSLALQNKIYRFCFLLFSFFLFLYLFYFLVNGEKGIFEYFKTTNNLDLNREKLNYLENKNKILEDRISRLSPNSLDLEFLDEKLRLKTGKISKNELVISFEN